MAKVNGKEIKFVSTAAWNEQFRGLEGALYINEAVQALTKHPVDMLVFEVKDNKMHIRSAGYDLATDSKLDETTVIFKVDSLPTPTFWLKIDNYGDHYMGTFLFPSEY